MKITPTLLAVASLGNLVVSSPVVGAPTVVDTDGSQLHKQILKQEKKKGIAFSGKHVPFSQDELTTMESMLNRFAEENRRRLKVDETLPSCSYLVHVGITCITGVCFTDENGLLTTKERKYEVELTSDQALNVEKFLNKVAEVTISEDRAGHDRKKKLASSVVGDNEMIVATAAAIIRPTFSDDSSSIAADPDLFRYLNVGSSEPGKYPISGCNLPLTKEEIAQFMGILETFERENALLKASGKFGWLSYGVEGIVSCDTAGCWGGIDNLEGFGFASVQSRKRIDVELYTEQAVVVTNFLDDIANKYIEQNRAWLTGKKLRGGDKSGEKFGIVVAGGVISGTYSLIRDSLS